MESHDEERMMFKNLNYGASTGSYDITEMETGFQRCELAAAFFFPIPGPKMIWQFGELGYDYSINYCPDGGMSSNCRTFPKPIRWDYYTQVPRRQLYNVYKELIYLKKEYPVFSTDDFTINVDGFQKTITLNGDEMDVAVLGNFATSSASITYSFSEGGYWYEYFTGDSLLAGDFAPDVIPLAAGEYRLYTNVKISDGIPLSIDEQAQKEHSLLIYPNPVRDELSVVLPDLNSKSELFIYSTSGVLIERFNINAGQELFQWTRPNALPSGMYFIKLVGEKGDYSSRVIIE
jgi:hypothetical protein